MSNEEYRDTYILQVQIRNDRYGPSPKQVTYTTAAKAQGTLLKRGWEVCKSQGRVRGI